MKDILPAHVRQKIYFIYAFLGLSVGATQVGFVSADVDQPIWLTVTLGVYAYLGIALGFTAGSNTNTKEQPDE
jgi:hypothetical protein